ncbi:MAG: hypothetical protein K0S45_140 [Nitrospira sp.]|nr:hypothetical protein [Nitrospira sp.]
MAVQRGRSKRRGEAYSEYVEPLNDARTKLVDFSTSGQVFYLSLS